MLTLLMMALVVGANASTDAKQRTHGAVSVDALGAVQLGPSLELDVTVHRRLSLGVTGRPVQASFLGHYIPDLYSGEGKLRPSFSVGTNLRVFPTGGRFRAGRRLRRSRRRVHAPRLRERSRPPRRRLGSRVRPPPAPADGASADPRRGGRLPMGLPAAVVHVALRYPRRAGRPEVPPRTPSVGTSSRPTGRTPTQFHRSLFG